MFCHSPTCSGTLRDFTGTLAPAPPSSLPLQSLDTCYPSHLSTLTLSPQLFASLTPFCVTNSCSSFKCQLKYDFPNPLGSVKFPHFSFIIIRSFLYSTIILYWSFVSPLHEGRDYVTFLHHCLTSI